MSLEFLRRVASRPLPYIASDVSEIDQIAVMRAAGLVSAFVPNREDAGYLAHATVLHITPRGWTALDNRDTGRPPA